MKKFLTLSLILATVTAYGATLTRDNEARIGDSNAGSSKVLKLGPDGQISWSGSKMQFSNDGGTNNVDIGSGTGGGAGINILATYNADMETVSAGEPANWTESGSSVLATEATNVHDGAAAASWDASASGETLSSQAVTIDANEFGGLNGENCSLVAYYLATGISAGDVKMEAVDGSANVLNTIDLEPTPANTWRRAEITFPCPFGTTLKAEFESTTNAAAVLIDTVFLGRYDLFDISQAAFVGSIRWEPTTNCSWSTASASYATFSVDADCDDNTVHYEGNAIPDASNPGQLPQIRFSSLAKGRYVVQATGRFDAYTNATGTSVHSQFRLYDGTNQYGAENAVRKIGASASVNQAVAPVILGEYTYNAAQGDTTIEIQGKTISATNAQVDAVNPGLLISVYRFPLDSEQGVKAETVDLSGSVFHGSSSASQGSGWGTFSAAGFASGRTFRGNASATATANDFGIRASNLKAGTYKVTASVTMYAQSGNDCLIGIYDGTARGGVKRVYNAGGTQEQYLSEITAEYTYSSFQPFVDFVLQGNRVSGSGSCVARTDSNSTGRISIEPITQQIPAPLFVKGVVNTRAGVTQIVSARISNAGTPTVQSEDGDWLGTLTDQGVGDTELAINSGIFSEVPRCFCNVYDAANIRTCQIDQGTAISTTAVRVQTGSDSGATIDTDFFIMCMGAK